jgi:hypothetical protein
VLIRIARPLYAADPIGVDLDHSDFATLNWPLSML